MYSLMPAGLHGENGLDPLTAVHVFQIYVLLVLLCGLEIAVPRLIWTFWKGSSELHSSRFYLHQLVSPAVYIPTGVLPAVAMIHNRIIALFGSICRLGEESVEKRLARR